MGYKIYRILLVDDDTEVLSVSERILKKLGYNVIAHSSSAEALELFKDLPSQFDLVITDFRMPEMNGADLSREILQIRPEIPIIICSGFGSEFGEQDAKALGIKWFVRKPFLKKDFVMLVEKVLKPKRYCILVVDDDNEVLQVFNDILETLGHSVQSYVSSEEALEIFKGRPNQFDLVITDFSMPKMNGADLSRKILQIKPDMPILMCTGFSCDFGEEDAKALGIKVYAEKPLPINRLASLVEHAVKEN